MTYPNEWMASPDHASLSGVSTITVGGKTYRTRLQSVQAHHDILEMLDAAFQQGKDSAGHSVIGLIKDEMDGWQRRQCST